MADFLAIESCRSLLEPFQVRWEDLADEAAKIGASEWIAHPDLHLTRSGWYLTPVRYFGADHPGAAQTSPVLAQLVMRDHRINGAGYYSLAAGASLAPHRGNPIGLARFHLALKVPEDCSITVGSTTRSWVEGEWLAFDDSIVHSARNDSDQDRHVLILDLEHPDVPVPLGAGFFRFASRTFYVTGRRFPALQVLAGRVNWISRAAQRASDLIARVSARRGRA